MSELTDLPNIAKKMKQQLAAVGITTPEQLRLVGSRGTWLRILAMDDSACLNRLLGLEGAIRGIRWHFLDSEVKAELKAFYHHHKGKPAPR